MNLTDEQMEELTDQISPNLIWVRALISEVRRLRHETCHKPSVADLQDLVSERDRLLAKIHEDAPLLVERNFLKDWHDERKEFIDDLKRKLEESQKVCAHYKGIADQLRQEVNASNADKLRLTEEHSKRVRAFQRELHEVCSRRNSLLELIEGLCAKSLSRIETDELVAAIFDDSDDGPVPCGTCGVPFGAVCIVCGGVLCTNDDCEQPGPCHLTDDKWVCSNECLDKAELHTRG